MRNAKKLMLLVLSLVLLVGIFAFAALAEEPATEATVVYPDGSTETVAVGETITPKEFTTEGEAKLFYGAGNTLFKATGDNWAFTVDGAALTDLTVTDAMVGKTIVAGGVDKVYASVEINITEGNYAIYQGGAYVLAGSTVDDVTIRKIPVGTHNLYFTNASDVQKFLNTTCSYEIDGVTYTHHDIRSLRANSAKVTLYENNKVSYISWSGSDADRPATAAGASSAGTNYPASVLLDLNGHTLVNTTTGYNDLRSMLLYIYSSVPGAFYDASAAANSMFRTNNDAAIYLGDDNDTETDYSDNINFLCKAVNEYLYGTGISIIGGNFYQTAPSANGMVNISRRFGIENAPGAIVNGKFYLFPGSNAVLNNATAAGTSISVSNCEFYTSSAAALVYTAKSDSKAFTVNADACSFYGVTQDYIRAADDTTTTATLNITNTVAAKDAVVYNTVNWADGTSSFYYATSEAEAKAFVENHPKAAQPTPYGKWVDGEYFVAFNPSLVYTYDDAFNAEQTLVDGDLTKVYYTLTIGDKVTYVTDGSTLNNYLRSMDYGVKITLYANHEVSTNYMGGRKSMEKNSAGSYIAMVTSYQLDLNGYTLTLTSSTRIESHAYRFFIYSSRPNGRIEAPNAATPFYTNNGDYKIIDGKEYGNTTAAYKASSLTEVKPTGSFYFGEAANPGSTNAGPYGKNLTVVCKSLVGGLYGNTIHIFGGTFIQLKGSSESIFLNYSNREVVHYHATFITTNPNTVPVNPNGSNKTYYNCTFVYDGVGSVALTNSATAGSFNNCNFVNVAPSYSAAHTYTNCAYGTTSYYPVADLDASDASAVYLAHGTTSKEITVNGKTLVLDGVLINDATTALKLTHEGFGTDYWVIGSTVNVPLDEITKVEGDQLFSGAYYDYSAIAEIVDGIVKAAGEATAVISFAKSEELAFSYLDTRTGVLDGVTYAECGGTAAGVGEKFYELFASPASAYEITMFKDMEISKAMGFGPFVKKADDYNRDYYNTVASGSIVWDLNGTTVTISKDVTGLINLAAANYDLDTPTIMNAYQPAVFGFEGTSVSNSFTLKSSKEGGKIVNESSAAIFGVGEGATTKVIFEGENLTLESASAPVFKSFEMSYDIAGWAQANKLRLIVNGGTYISGGDYVFKISTYAQLANATFISTNPYAVSVVSHDTSRAGAATVTNCTFIAANSVAIAYKAGSTKGASLSFSGGTFANCLIPTTENCANLTVAYAEGTYYTATFEDLAKLYASAPAGTVRAAKSVAYNGVSYKLCGYYAETESFVTVQIPLAGINEIWVVGGEYIYSTSIENVNVVYQDGKYYYRANPVWTARLGGEVITDILSSYNAGKTVVLDVEGDTELIYAVRDIAGVKTYFYGDVEKVNAELIAMFNAMQTSSTVTFYEDFTLTITGGCQIVNAGGGTQNIDLNGHTLKVVSTLVETDTAKKQYALKFQNGHSYVYSSVPGGVIDASEMRSLVMTDSSGHAHFGESSTSGTAYGKNLTVVCTVIFSRLYSTNAYFVGGTYVQAEGASVSFFWDINEGPVPTFANCTFIVNAPMTSFICGIQATYTNCTFIAKDTIDLIAMSAKGNGTAVAFNGCYFYNIIPNVIEGVTVTYTDCHFDKASDIAQAGGYIAYTGETVTLTVKGETYAFAAKLYAAGEVALIDWGFDMKEYWAIGAKASHADVLLDQFFTYSYAPFTVEGDCVAEKTLTLAEGTVQMSLTLQSQIGVNLYFSEALSNATVKYAGAEIPLATLVAADGFYKLSDAIAPNVADQVATVTIVIGENEHVLTVGIGAYARAVLASDAYADVHKLTYAMVEYVRSMVASDFLAGVGAPDGYEVQVVDTEKVYNKGENVLLKAISFNLSGTIEIAIEAGDAEDGAAVTLTLASGRTVTATIEGGVASFEGLYINEFYGDLTISVGNETYSYCIENYYNAMDEAHKPAIAALYTYAYYAVEYVATLQ